MSDKMDGGIKKFLLSVSFLVFAFNGKFVNCLIEYSNLTPEEIVIEMEIFEYYSSIYELENHLTMNERLLLQLKEFIEKEIRSATPAPAKDDDSKKRHKFFKRTTEIAGNSPTKNSPAENSNSTKYLNLSKMLNEFRNLLKHTVHYPRKKDPVFRASKLIVIFLAAKYALIFAEGHLHYKKNNNDHENKANSKYCAELAQYLAKFAGNAVSAYSVAVGFSKTLATKHNEFGSNLHQLSFDYTNIIDCVESQIASNYNPADKMINCDKIEIRNTDFFEYLESDLAFMIYGEKYQKGTDSEMTIYVYGNQRGYYYGYITWEHLSTLLRMDPQFKKNVVDILRIIEFQRATQYLDMETSEEIKEVLHGFTDKKSFLELLAVPDNVPNTNISQQATPNLDKAFRLVRISGGEMSLGNTNQYIGVVLPEHPQP